MPSGIDLEITESLVMQDIEANIQKLTEVHGLGLAIAIDDFGTGLLLARLPGEAPGADAEDRPLVHHIDGAYADTLSLVRMIISLAHFAAADRGCRGCRDRRAGEDAAAAGLRRDAGLTSSASRCRSKQ
jgi:EAL domain-containing protein (putative c-di-GMP-specific phosphodiesterase class I)